MNVPTQRLDVIKRLVAEAHARQPDRRGLANTCEEASPFSVETKIDCGQPATMFVLSERGRAVYMMCDGCAYHNEKNRGATLVGTVGRG